MPEAAAAAATAPAAAPASAAPAAAPAPATAAATTPAPAAVASPAPAAAASEPAYNLKAPEGMDPAALPKIIERAKAYGISPEKAQQLVDDAHKSQVQAKTDMDAALAKQKADWHAEILADKNIGGDKFQATIARAQQVITKIDAGVAPGIAKILADTGYGDHPAVVRLFAHLGEQNREDTFAVGGGPSAGEQPQTLAQMLYPKPKT
jgi:hypothetical protein